MVNLNQKHGMLTLYSHTFIKHMDNSILEIFYRIFNYHKVIILHKDSFLWLQKLHFQCNKLHVCVVNVVKNKKYTHHFNT